MEPQKRRSAEAQKKEEGRKKNEERRTKNEERRTKNEERRARARMVRSSSAWAVPRRVITARAARARFAVRSALLRFCGDP
jgi:hypothetical protein